ncbi:MAG TPA: ABC transporter permease subunit [Vicinamibacterales bacterium]|nr:ABC transporter permease subunit [Vicinamibacterales bacterium]
MKDVLIVARKEIQDHLRDTRSLASSFLYASMGPAVVLLVSLSNSGDTARRATLLVSMASVFALVSAVAGGMSVAMDAMAGERERRSLVPLLLTPASRFDLVLGKWLATCAFALGALTVTICGFLPVVLWRAPVGWIVLVQLGVWVLLGLIPLALAGSAAHLLLSANSRTTQEANGWLSIAVFLPMLAGMFLVFFPSWVGTWWFLVPIIGQQSLVIRGLAGQPATVVQAAVLAVVTLAVAIPALLATRRALERDDVVTG